MQTSCPECRTTFRVTQAHLGLRRGLVRCGQCNAVFNAYDTLLPELEEPPILPRTPMLDALSDNATLPELTLPDWPDQTATYPDLSIPEPTESPAPPNQTEAIVPDQEADRAEEDPAAEAADSPEAILLSELPTRKIARPALTWKRLAYGLASLALLWLLAMQLALFLRADLVALAPASRPALESLCAPLGCEVPLPRQLTNQAISASNLEHDPEQKARVRLTLLLSNRTGQTQAWPQLSLTLTDVRESPVAQKLFPPASYLPKGTKIVEGIADRGEQEIRLDLDIGNLAATGYALSLVYP